MERYARNAQSISAAETEYLHSRCVAVVGLGGLGGYVVELLARVGVGKIVGIDCDAVETTNLNRQLLATEANLGQPKAAEAAKRLAAVNSQTAFTPVQALLTAENAAELLAGCDLVVDCSDNIPARLAMEAAAEALGVPLVHGAIAGWYGQVGVSFPGDRMLAAYYRGCEGKGAEAALGNPSFTPALVAALQAAETIKVLLHKDGVLRNRLLYIDALLHQYDVTEMGENRVREEDL